MDGVFVPGGNRSLIRSYRLVSSRISYRLFMTSIYHVLDCFDTLAFSVPDGACGQSSSVSTGGDCFFCWASIHIARKDVVYREGRLKVNNERMLRLLQDKMSHIQRYLIRLGASRADAEDIVQDTVYKGLLYLDSIVPDKFSAWLYRVALNRYYDMLRKRKRIEWSIEEATVEDSEIPEDILLRKERREEIERVMEALTPIYKQLLILKYELDFSYREISDLVGIREEMVKTYLYRARKQFQKKYGGLYDER